MPFKLNSRRMPEEYDWIEGATGLSRLDLILMKEGADE
jgi:hypothetical protein